MKFAKYLCIAALMFSSANVAVGQSTVSIDAFDTGWYDNLGVHLPDNLNYFAGGSADTGTYTNNFSVFDVSSLGSNVSQATLRMFNTDEKLSSGNGYESPDPTETYTLFDVSTDLAILLDGFGGLEAFDDLASGVSYGEQVVSSADNGRFVEIELNAEAISALNSTDDFL